MSLKRNRKYIFRLFIIVILFFSISESIKLEMSSKILEMNSQLFHNNKNIRSLVERNMEITNYKYFLMETEICVGTPKQCFKVLYDTGTPYLILGIPNSNLKFKKSFNSLMSDSFSSTSDKMLAIPFKSSIISGREVRDKVSIIPKYRLPYLFSFVLSWNSSDAFDY